MKIVKNIYFNIRITKDPQWKEYLQTIAIPHDGEELSKVIARALKSLGYQVTITKFVTSENITWKDIRI